MQSAADLEAFLIKQGMFFLHVCNVLGMCGGIRVQSHASYAEACSLNVFIPADKTTNKYKLTPK